MTLRQRLAQRLVRYLTTGSQPPVISSDPAVVLQHLASTIGARRATVSIHDGRVRIRWPQGFELYYSGDGNSITYAYVRDGSYEDAELALFTANLHPGDIFFDIGANAGLFSICAAQTIRSGHIYSFEPLSSTFGELRENIALNQAERLVTPVMAALSDHAGEGLITTGFHGSNYLIGPGSAVPTARIVIDTLDGFVAREKIDHIDFIKIDVEGWELPVAQGGLETLRRLRPMLLAELMEYPPDFHDRAKPDYRELLKLMAGLGYQYYVVDDRGQVVPGTSYVASPTARSYHNYLFYDPAKHQPALSART
jgi:FkbM family methyltransferase